MQTNIKTKLTIVGMGVLFSTTAASQSITLEPQSVEIYNASHNATFNIQVHLSGENIAGIQFNLNYNFSIIEAVDVSEGNFLKQNDIDSGSGVLTIPTTIDNNIGEIKFASARIEKSGVSGSGNIANITFKTKAFGTTALELNNVKIRSPDRKAVDVKVNDGVVIVGSSQNLTQDYQNSSELQNPQNNYFLVVSLIVIVLLMIILSKFAKSK